LNLRKAIVLGLAIELSSLPLVLLVLRANAETQIPGVIEAGVSQNHFYIEPSYDGTTITLFASVDRDKLKGRPFDVAVTVRGPIKSVTVWKKHRRAGLWVNSRSLTFEGVPNFYAVLSTKRLGEIAPLDKRRPFEIGLDALSLPVRAGEEPTAQTPASPEFQEALIRLKKASGLFVEADHSDIEFLGERLFRARVFLPAAAGPGLYRANFYVFQKGDIAGTAASHIRLKKIGIEARLSSAATEHPWLYGVAAVLLAAAVGSGASLVFRRS
jgi:uncharacterized protein (TIGR02186 family)